MARKTMTVEISAEMRAALDYVAERFGLESDTESLEKCVIGFHGRQKALDDHKAKLDAVKAAKKDGKKLPKGVAFKRYVPAFTDKSLDASGTDQAVAKWAHVAPSKATIYARESKRAAKH